MLFRPPLNGGKQTCSCRLAIPLTRPHAMTAFSKYAFLPHLLFISLFSGNETFFQEPLHSLLVCFGRFFHCQEPMIGCAMSKCHATARIPNTVSEPSNTCKVGDIPPASNLGSGWATNASHGLRSASSRKGWREHGDLQCPFFQSCLKRPLLCGCTQSQSQHQGNEWVGDINKVNTAEPSGSGGDDKLHLPARRSSGAALRVPLGLGGTAAFHRSAIVQ